MSLSLSLDPHPRPSPTSGRGEIRQTAIALLARRDHSQVELFRKLRVKNFPDENIHAVIHALAESGLQSDARFAESYIRYRRTKGYGPVRIRLELIERGIAEEIIQHLINNKESEWQLQAEITWKKRFKNTKPHDFKTRAQHMRFLQYRGFTQEQIGYCFK